MEHAETLPSLVSSPKPELILEQTDVSCPLCDYDLRGSVDPRCPECGYPFDWAELRDPSKRRHPYLFEHHPRRNIWSLVRTLAGGLRPARFWATVTPSQPSNPKRLGVYFLLTSGLVGLMPMVISLVLSVWDAAALAQSQRVWMSLRLNSPNPPAWATRLLSAYGSADAVLDDYAPRVLSWRFPSYAWGNSDFREAVAVGLGGLACWFGWPILTGLVLMIFRWSMQRARVRPIHVARCVVYSGDAGFWAGGIAVISALVMLLTGAVPRQIGVSWLGLVAVTCSMLVIFSYRLAVAYRQYLRFDRPLATVAASQVIVALVVLNVLCFVMMIRSGGF